MQNYQLVRDFREWISGLIFVKHPDGEWSCGGEFEKQPSNVLDTLMDVGGYLSFLEETEFTPEVGDTFYYITGAAEIKAKEWTNSDWCHSVRDFMGIFETREEAQLRLAEIENSLESPLF